MKLSNISTQELLSYSTILENIVTTNLSLISEINEAIIKGFCTKEKIQKILDKCSDSKCEADEVYAKIQKELDMRIKRDLGMKFGITRTQSVIKELDAFVIKTNQEFAKQNEIDVANAKLISEETVQMNIVNDDDNS